MFFDKEVLLADNQTITSDAAGTVGSSAAVLELGGDDYSKSWVAIVVKAAVTGAGSVDVILQTNDTDSTFTAGNVNLHTETLTATNGTLGKVIAFKVPLGLKKYTRVYFDVTDTVSTGKVTVGITDGIQTA